MCEKEHSKAKMALLSRFSQLSFNLLIWFFLNGLIFLAPSLSWIKYPILLNIETLLVAFVFSCIYDAGHWRPWQDKMGKIWKGEKRARQVAVESFKRYLLQFGSLAAIWSMEILFQKVVFSTVFTSTVYYIDHGKDPLVLDEGESVPLACMDGTILFSIRQMAIIVVLIGTLVLEWRDVLENRYLLKTAFPVVLISMGAFAAVWNNQTEKSSVGNVFLAMGWVFLRSFRLMMTKWVQANHMQQLLVTRFLRLLLPLMFAILIPGFFIFEMSELQDVRAVLLNTLAPSDADWLGVVFSHIGKVMVYSVLFFSSLMLLLNGGNSVDYNSWLMLREVIWNTACGYAMGAGELTPHILAAHQIAGLVAFFCGWFSYSVLFVGRFIQRNRDEAKYYIQVVDFSGIKEVDVNDIRDDPLKTRILASQRFSDNDKDEEN